MNSSSVHDTLDAVLFSAGGHRAGFEAREVRASHPAPAGATGAEIEILLGLEPPTGMTSRQYLQLKHSDGDREVLVGGPVELRPLAGSDIHPLPPLVAARCRLKHLRALAFAADGGAQTLVLLFGSDVLNPEDIDGTGSAG